MADLALSALPPAHDPGQIMVLCDRAIGELNEARSVEEVLDMRNVADAFGIYLRKMKAAVEARSAVQTVVLLAEAKIGAELKAAQERGEVAKAGNPELTNVRQPDNSPAQLADLGIPRQRAAEYKVMAEIGEPAIRRAVADATADGRVITRQAILDTRRDVRAAARQAAIGDTVVPTPASAKRQATETGGYVLATDGNLHGPDNPAERQKQLDLYQFRDLVRGLAAVTVTPARAMEVMTEADRHFLRPATATALAWLSGLKELFDAE